MGEVPVYELVPAGGRVTAYYSEWDPYAAQWLRNLIAAGLIAPGDVDERSIVDVRPDDLKGYTQVHFFAGIGGWSLAARLAGWPDDRPLWSASAPCQPFSVAGKQKGTTDERHLWPEAFRLIDARRPDVVVGEQVAAAVGKDWLDGVFADLEGVGYACGAVVVPACAVDAPHRRDRLWFVADAGSGRRAGSGEGQGQFAGRAETVGTGEGTLADAQSGRWPGECLRSDGKSPIRTPQGCGAGTLADANDVGVGQERQQRGGELCRAGGDPQSRDGDVAYSDRERLEGVGSDYNPVGRTGSHVRPNGLCDGAWSRASWLIGADGKARRVEPSIRLLAHGVPARVGKLRAFGNAIVPQVGAEILRAYLDRPAFVDPFA